MKFVKMKKLLLLSLIVLSFWIFWMVNPQTKALNVSSFDAEVSVFADAQSPVFQDEILNWTKAYNCNAQTEIPVTECEALVQFYNVSWWPNWTNRAEWLVTNTPCSWYGISCTTFVNQETNVVLINLENNNLSGGIYLSWLVKLQWLSLWLNKINSLSENQFDSLNGLKMSLIFLNNNPISFPDIIDVTSLTLDFLSCPTNYIENPGEQKCVLNILTWTTNTWWCAVQSLWVGTRSTCILLNNWNTKCRWEPYNMSYTWQNAIKMSLGQSNNCVILNEWTITCRWDSLIFSTWLWIVDIWVSQYWVCMINTSWNVNCNTTQNYNNYWQFNSYNLWDAKQVKTSTYHTCILKNNWNVFCQGLNEDGYFWHYYQSDDFYTWWDAKQVDVWPFHVCVLKDNWNVQCRWNGFLWNTVQYDSGDAVYLSVAANRTCILKNNWNVYCWWTNTVWQSNPYTGGDAIALRAGAYHTCILKNNWNVFCRWNPTWNDNKGQVISYTGWDIMMENSWWCVWNNYQSDLTILDVKPYYYEAYDYWYGYGFIGSWWYIPVWASRVDYMATVKNIWNTWSLTSSTKCYDWSWNVIASWPVWNGAHTIWSLETQQFVLKWLSYGYWYWYTPIYQTTWTKQIMCKVDPENLESESNENNNTFSGLFSVELRSLIFSLDETSPWTWFLPMIWVSKVWVVKIKNIWNQKVWIKEISWRSVFVTWNYDRSFDFWFEKNWQRISTNSSWTTSVIFNWSWVYLWPDWEEKIDLMVDMKWNSWDVYRHIFLFPLRYEATWENLQPLVIDRKLDYTNAFTLQLPNYVDCNQPIIEISCVMWLDSCPEMCRNRLRLSTSRTWSNPEEISNQSTKNVWIFKLENITNNDITINNISSDRVWLWSNSDIVYVRFEKNWNRVSGKTNFSSGGTALISFAPNLSISKHTFVDLDMVVQFSWVIGSNHKFTIKNIENSSNATLLWLWTWTKTFRLISSTIIDLWIVNIQQLDKSFLNQPYNIQATIKNNWNADSNIPASQLIIPKSSILNYTTWSCKNLVKLTPNQNCNYIFNIKSSIVWTTSLTFKINLADSNLLNNSMDFNYSISNWLNRGITDLVRK